MTSKRNYLLLVLVCAMSVAGLHTGVQGATTQGAETQGPASAIKVGSADVQLGLQFGFEGNWKLGHLCPVRVDLIGLESQTGLQTNAMIVELQTLDGDGVTVTYRRRVDQAELVKLASGASCLWMPIRVGRQQAGISVRVQDADDRLVAEKRLESDEFPAPLASTQPLIVALGSTQGVESASSSNLAGGATTFTTAAIKSAESLPDAPSGYAPCDLVILPTNDLSLLQAIRPLQWQALDQWIRDGGACLISLGPNSKQIDGLREFKALLPGEILDFGNVTNPGPLESNIVGTKDPIEAFEATRIAAGKATVDLTLQDSLNRRLPWLSRYAYGLGTIQLVASDLEQPAFAQWPDRNKLWRSLLSKTIDLGVAEKSLDVKVGNATYLGYDDLVGQLRASLDVFPSLTVVTFGQAVAIIVAILLVIGPLDYLLSVKWLKRPNFSWYFACSMLTLASLALMALQTTLRPDEIRVNSVQLIDVDTASNQATGHFWSHVYTNKARQVDLALQTSAPEPDAILQWQGLPGRGLGGIMSQLNTDLGMPAYAIEQNATGQSEFQQVGIPTAGTKCVSASWHQSLDFENKTTLKEIPGIDQLDGNVVNPLSVDLKDCMLLYHHWYYSMPSRILPGQSIRVSFETIPKDLSRRLNGRRVVQGSEQITPWNPSERNSVPRLLEMLMFYKAASGPNYTSLLHRYQPHLDFSNLLNLDRAIMVGRLDEPLASLNVSGDAGTPSVIQDMDQTWVRLVFPVEQNQSK
jgi:hypothetical protein